MQKNKYIIYSKSNIDFELSTFCASVNFSIETFQGDSDWNVSDKFYGSKSK